MIFTDNHIVLLTTALNDDRHGKLAFTYVYM